MKIIKDRIKRAFSLTDDLVGNLSQASLSLKLKELPSNTMGQQLWCMVGARESYDRAIRNMGWLGFSCSLKDPESIEAVDQAIKKSATDILAYLEETSLNNLQLELLMDLLEHEIQHHGQLIRFVYGNKMDFPKSWNKRYTV
jgi:hypothetical protein